MRPNGQASEKRNVEGAFTGCSVVVTGGTGFIGTHLCTRLRALGARVVSISRREDDAGNRRVDLTDFHATRRIIEQTRPDYVFHLASHVFGAPELRHVLPTFQSNLQTTVHLLTAVAEFGCKRIVLTGSLVEPDGKEGEKVPSSPYAAAKWASGDYARMFHALYSLPVTIARVFMVYGPGKQDVSKLVPYVIRTVQANDEPLITSGMRQIDWIYVSDVVEGFLAIATAEGIEGETVDLGSGELISTHDFVLQILSHMRSSVKPRFGALPDRPFEPVRVADVNHTYELTKWSPTVTLDEGLIRTINYFTGIER